MPGGQLQGGERREDEICQDAQDGQGREEPRAFRVPGEQQVGDPFRFEGVGDQEQQDQEHGVFGSLAGQLEGILLLPGNIRLGDLGVDGDDDVVDKLFHDPFHLARDASGRVHRDAVKQVGDDIDALGVQQEGAGSEKVPTGETEHLPEQLPVEGQPTSGLFEMPSAIQHVGSSNDDGDNQEKDGIKLEFVERGQEQADGHRQFEDGFQDADVGEGRHPLMGRDAGIERNVQQLEHEDAQGTVENHVGGAQTAVWHVQSGVQEPEADCFHEHDDDDGDRDHHGQAGGKHLGGLFAVTFPQRYVDVPADGRGQGGGQDVADRHDAADGLIKAVIVEAQCAEDDAGGDQADDHEQEHAEIQENRIPGDSPAAFRYFLGAHGNACANSQI